MKLLAVIFCLVVSVDARGQGKDDSLRHANENVLYIVDGVPKLKGQINQDSIFIKDVLKGSRLDNFMSAVYSEKKLDSIVLIITKQSSIYSYQNKFNILSKNYRIYMKKYNDTDMYYVINGKQVGGSADEIVRTLYELPADKIKYVGVIDHHKDTAVLKSVVVITTKQ